MSTENEIISNEVAIALLDNLAQATILLTPQLNHLLSDATTPEQRQEFRALAGRSRVFELSNDIFRLNQLMNALCSETARNILKTA